MARKATALALLMQATSSSGLALIAPRMPVTAAASAATAAFAPTWGLRAAAYPRSGSARMDASLYDEFLATDVVTGERKIIGFAEKEKLYLDCLDAYYNDEAPVLSNEEYEQLKRDLEFEGSTLTGFSKDEIKFLVANKRYREGKPFLDDKEYDKLRLTLKNAGSAVVLHEAPSCKTDGECKMDLRVDSGKNRLLYLPGCVAGSVIFSEALYWTVHLDPLISIILGAVPAFFFGKWFTENIFAQAPLVTASACPNCNYLISVYFGDLFNVQKDDIMGKGKGPAGDIVEVQCPNCKIELKADRSKMVVIGSTAKAR